MPLLRVGDLEHERSAGARACGRRCPPGPCRGRSAPRLRPPPQDRVADDLLHGGLVHLAGAMAPLAALAPAAAGPSGLRDLPRELAVATVDEQRRDVELHVGEPGVDQRDDLRASRNSTSLRVRGLDHLPDLLVQLGLDRLGLVLADLGPDPLLPLLDGGVDPASDEEVVDTRPWTWRSMTASAKRGTIVEDVLADRALDGGGSLLLVRPGCAGSSSVIRMDSAPFAVGQSGVDVSEEAAQAVIAQIVRQCLLRLPTARSSSRQ